MTAIDAVQEVRSEFRPAAGIGVCVSVAAHPAQPAWFEPDHWGARAAPVEVGGRGAAWFIDSGRGRWVLRRYRRGGLVARVSQDRYLFTGEQRVRSVAEFRLLARLRALGLPVPAPVAAMYVRRAGMYRAALLIERIENVRPLSAWLVQEAPAGMWDMVGRTLARFHAAGVDHADLNANNILVADQAVWLIDFDRGQLRAADGAWRQGNLDRLQRSLQKLGGIAADAVWRSGWQRALQAYAGEGGAG